MMVEKKTKNVTSVSQFPLPHAETDLFDAACTQQVFCTVTL